LPANNTEIEKRLWDAADELRANSKLRSQEYSAPVLGLIFLRYAGQRFAEAEAALAGKGSARRPITRADYQARGVMYLPEPARWSKLVNLREGEDIGGAINGAMRSVEAENEDLRDVLPKTYNTIDNRILAELIRLFNSVPMNVEGDTFGRIYEYFLSKFAMTEGQKGGEFFTPTSIVKLIVDIIEPFHGRIFDPACGSGGMFVQSARFVERHQQNPSQEISIYGQERASETRKLCMLNLAVHGLSGDIREGNSYYENIHDSVGRFDYVMANPPFNVDRVDKERLKDDRRFPLGLPRVDNANYLWIQVFYSALNATGRAGFVMANSASDARASEQDIRRQLIQSGAVDVMVAISSNFFYTVTLPVTLWFLDRRKTANLPSPSGRGPDAAGVGGEGVLFIDARHIFRQIDRAHRDFTPEQSEFLANIVRLYRDEAPEFDDGSKSMLTDTFPGLEYRDVPGLCKTATIAEIETQGWSLNPGRYVGVADRAPDEFLFTERLGELNEELEVLNAEAAQLQERIAENVSILLQGS
jgi:type I restriction enzyme M protein